MNDQTASTDTDSNGTSDGSANAPASGFKARSRGLYAWICDRAKLGIVIGWLMTIAACFGPWHWIADAFNHTLWHVTIACLPASLLLWKPARRWSIAACLCLTSNLAFIAPWSWYLDADATDSLESQSMRQDLRVLYWNINAGLPALGGVLQVIEQENPDVVAILELHFDHTDELAALRTSHPHHHEIPQTDSFGIGVYSRLPIEFEMVDREFPGLRGVLDVRGVEVQVAAVHVLPPMGAIYRQTRNEQFEKLAEDLAGMPDEVSTLVGGDLNITPWCREFIELCESTDLRDSRAGHGYQATWPAKLGFTGIPIDHVLVSHQVDVLDRKTVGSGAGSDHLGVLVTLAVRSD